MTDDEILALVSRRLRACPEFRGLLAEAAQRQKRVDAAAALLRAGKTRAEAQAILRERFGISRRNAYEILDLALRIRTLESAPC